jgi:hypothetical protein
MAPIRLRSRLLLVLPALVLLALPATAGPTASPFADQATLERDLAPACDMVEAITGLKYETRPTVRVSDPASVAKILVHEFQALPDEMLGGVTREQLAHGVARYLMAKYDPATHVIHVLPSAVDLVRKAQKDLPPLGEEHLRVLLAHEATHAMDFETYPIMALRARRRGVDGQQALNAVVEGHAQYVAEEAARRWKLTPAFDRITQAIAGTDDPSASGTEQALRNAMLSQIRFAYVQGHNFFTAVAKARGAAGVVEALRHPPTGSRQIEHPDLWLHPAAQRPQPDVKTLVDAFRPVFDAKAFSLTTNRVLEAALRSQAVRLPQERRAGYLRGYQDGWILLATVPGRDLRVVCLVALFDTPENARGFVGDERLVVETAKEMPGVTFETRALKDGAGPNGRLPGFYLDRLVHVAGEDVPVEEQVSRQGRFAVEVTALNAPFFGRAAQDAALAYVDAVLRDPEAAASLPRPHAVTPPPAAKTGRDAPTTPGATTEGGPAKDPPTTGGGGEPAPVPVKKPAPPSEPAGPGR